MVEKYLCTFICNKGCFMRKIINTYLGLNRSTKVSLWYIICTIIQNGISFITLPVFIRLLTVEQYGVLTLYGSWKSIVSIFATFNISSGVFMTAYVKFEGDEKKLLSSLQSLSTVITISAFFIYLIFQVYLNKIMSLPTEVISVMFLEILVQPAFIFWSTKLKYEKRYIPMVVVSLLIAVINPILGIMAVVHSENKAFAKILSSAIVFLLFYGFIYVINLKEGKKFFDLEYWKYALRLGIPLVPHYLSLVILGQSDRVMIGSICGSADAAIYGLGYTVATVINVIYGGIDASLGPSIMQKLNKKSYGDLSKLVNRVLLFMGTLLFGVSLIYPEVIKIVTTEEYYDVINIMPIITFSIFFACINNCFAKIEFFYENKYFIMLSSCVSAGVNVILNAICIPAFGYKAASVTTLACYILLSIAHYFNYRFICVQKLGVKSVYDDTSILIMALLVILTCIGVICLYSFLIIRMVLVLIMVAMVIIKRKSIFRLLLSTKCQ